MAELLCAAAMRVAGERRDGAAGAARPAARWAGARCVESQARLLVLGGEQVVGQLQRLGRLLVLGELDQHVVVVRLALADGRVQRDRDLRARAQRSRILRQPFTLAALYLSKVCSIIYGLACPCV